MAINFPNAPANNQVFTAGSTVYTWNGYAWAASTASGSKGQKGEVGIKGDAGLEGAKGDKGGKGDGGTQGIKGDQGIPGAAASKGEKGDKGPIGTQGIAGPTGSKGATGDKGQPVPAQTLVVTNSGSGAYLIRGQSNPTLTLVRGFRYEFAVNASGHPFFIKTVVGTGTGNQYTSGVTNNGAQVGTIIFDVPSDAPSLLYYQCQFHAPMVGQIIINEAGEKGIKGDAGSAGTKGDTGSAGIKGDAGSAGIKGDAGSAGIKGDKGEIGPKGDMGDKGDLGNKGERVTVWKSPTPPVDTELLWYNTTDANFLVYYNNDGSPVWVDASPTIIGDKGDQGIQGIKGDTGAKGEIGTKGDIGPAPTLAPINYAQNTAPQITTSTSNTVLASVDITLTSGPAQIIASGDANPLSAGAWGRLQIYRGSTPIGGIVHYESSAGNENVPYSIQFVDAPGAGTYTYSLRMLDATNSTQFGESSGPVITVTELGNVKGEKGDGVIAGIGGSNTFVIVNDLGTANGSAGFTFDKATNNAFIANTLSINGAGLTLASQSGISANGTLGTAGQSLTTNGSAVYWGAGGKLAGTGLSSNDTHYSVFANTGLVANVTGLHVAGIQTLANTTITGVLTLPTTTGISANGTLGTAGQSLTTNGSAVYWGAGGKLAGEGLTANDTHYSVAGVQSVGNTTITGFANVTGLATFGANASFGNNFIIAPVLKAYAEDKQASNVSTVSTTLDFSNTNVFELTMSSNTTFAFTNPPANTRMYTATLIIRQDGTGGRTIAWPTTARYPGGVQPPPTTTANAIDIWTVTTFNSGNTHIISLSVKDAR